MTTGFNRTGNFKSDRPKKTLVIDVEKSEVAPLLTLIDAYKDQLPPRLQALLDKVKIQLGTSRD